MVQCSKITTTGTRCRNTATIGTLCTLHHNRQSGNSFPGQGRSLTGTSVASITDAMRTFNIRPVNPRPNTVRPRTTQGPSTPRTVRPRTTQGPSTPRTVRPRTTQGPSTPRTVRPRTVNNAPDQRSDYYRQRLNYMRSLHTSPRSGENECTICMETPVDRINVPCCKKPFCYECIKAVIQRKDQCPVCRADQFLQF